MQNSRFVRFRVLCLAIALHAPFACKMEGPECVTYVARFEELKEAVPDAEMCGISDQLDEAFNAEIATCLAENLENCLPAYGQFLAVPPGSDHESLYAGFSDEQCSVTVLLTTDPESEDAVFTEVKCKIMRVPGETSLVALEQCEDKISYPACPSSSSP